MASPWNVSSILLALCLAPCLVMNHAEASASADRALALALERGNERAARYWLEMGADPGFRGADPFGAPVLLRAILSGRPRLVRLLLDRGADPGARDRRGTPILVSAAAMAQGKRRAAITASIAELFVQTRLNPDIADRAYLGDDRSALHVAASIGNLELARLLLKAGADPNRVNRVGETPLFFAAERGWGELVEELVSMGASAHLRSRYTGMTPLALAAEGGHADIVRLLLKLRANPASRDAFGKTPVDLARRTASVSPSLEAAQALASLENAWMRQTFQSTLEWLESPKDSGVARTPLRQNF